LGFEAVPGWGGNAIVLVSALEGLAAKLQSNLPLPFLVALAITAAYLAAFSLTIARVRFRHPRIWVQLGSPKFFPSSLSFRSEWRTMKFVLFGRTSHADDRLLSVAAIATRVLLLLALFSYAWINVTNPV
jgi:hypothetical protein